MNTPALETQRLQLRSFTEQDIDALYLLLKDETVNTFLPWFPLKALQEARGFYEERFAKDEKQPFAYHYAICLKGSPAPIGYINVSGDDSHDFGYGLREEFWHKGIATEAGKAVVQQLKKAGMPYITATHDVNNPRSGGVMKRLGMQYQYSYQELVQPKNELITFRMYQLNLDENRERVYQKYWEQATTRFREPGI